jgi:hypothetical protein
LGHLTSGGFSRYGAYDGLREDRSGAVLPRILAAIANPELQQHAPPGDPADVARHRAVLEDVLGTEQVGFVEPPVTFARIRERLLEDGGRRYNVLHMVAPGGIDTEGAFILLEGDRALGSEKLRPGQLERLVAEEARELGLVVLVADHSAHCSQTEPGRGFGLQVSRHGPAVIALRGSMAPDAAVTLERIFYRKLVGDGKQPIDQALNWGRSIAITPPSRDVATPVLFAHGDEALERFSPRVLVRSAQDDAYPTQAPSVPLCAHLHAIATDPELGVMRQGVRAYGHGVHRGSARATTASRRTLFRLSAFSAWLSGDSDVERVA